MTKTNCVPGFDVDDLPPPSTPARVAKPNDTSVILRGVRVPLNSDVGAAFVSDCCRNRERIFSDDRLREKYDISSDSDWNNILNNKSLRLAISAEGDRRMLAGTTAQEAAAKIFMNSPTVMGEILNDKSASPRHRIEASKELRATARPGDEKSNADADRFHIVINMGNDQVVVDSGPLLPKQAKEASDAENEW